MNDFLAEKLLDEVLTHIDRPTPNPPNPEDSSDRFVTHVLVPAQSAAEPADQDQTETQDEPER